MVWENRVKTTESCCSAAAPRKFYSYDKVSESDCEVSSKDISNSSLIKYVGENIIGKNIIFESPFGNRKVVYADYTATGRSLHFIEDYIRDQVLPSYGSTHNTDTNTALQTTMFRHEARDIIKSCVRASESDTVLLTGSGATGAVHRLLHGLNLISPPVVLAGPFLHHSALLPWREAGATVIRVQEDATGAVDMSHLEELLKQFNEQQSATEGKEQARIIGCFSAASNITGVLTDTIAVTVMLHSYGALAFWDYATAAPYVELDMNPVTVGDSNGQAHKDAMFFSLHKFIGGPQTPGVLVVKKALMRHSVPAVPAGGTVFFVSRDAHRYLQEHEEKEEGGTPSIVEDIRGGLVLQLKQAISVQVIMERNKQLTRQLAAFCKRVTPLGLIPLGPNFKTAEDESTGSSSGPHRLPILSFLVGETRTGLMLHYKYVTALLNDMFGVQARGGCACAGPYGLDLLGINESLAQKIHEVLVEPCGLDRHHLRRRQEHSDSEVLRPGFVRLNLSYAAADEEISFILSAVEWVCVNGWKMLPLYSFNPETGEWKHRQQQSMTLKGRQWLGNISYSGGAFSLRQATSAQGHAPDYQLCLAQADELLERSLKACRTYTATDHLTLSAGAASLRWFLLPIEARNILLPDNTTIYSASPPFRPVQYPLSSEQLQSRPDSVWQQPARMFYWPIGRKSNDDETEVQPTANQVQPNATKNNSLVPRQKEQNKFLDGHENSNGFLETNNGTIKIDESYAAVDKDTNKIAPNKHEQIKIASSDNVNKDQTSIDSGKVVCTDNSCFLPRPQTQLSITTVRAKWHAPAKNLFNPMVEAVKLFNMIRDGDRVLLCLSGGKDSLSLLHLLHHYQYYARSQGINYTLGAVTVDPESAAYDPRPLIPYLKSLGVEYLYEQQGILQQALELTDLNSICSFCSRMKRGRIYAAARKHKYNVLAFGQHLDDLAESFLMSVLHNGRLRTMKASYTVQDEDLRVIRPLVFVREKHLRHFAESKKLPVIPENCPACFEVPKERHRSKQLLAQQELLFPQVYSSLRTALLPLMSISAAGVENGLLGKQAHLNKLNETLSCDI